MLQSVLTIPAHDQLETQLNCPVGYVVTGGGFANNGGTK